jgi:hypothetical protein
MELPTTIYGPDGALGPKFSFADEIPTPDQIGVHPGGDFDAIIGAAAGVSYYVDTIGFGSASMVSQTLGAPNQSPIGLRYFMKSGMKCSNGNDMYEYVNSIPQGDALGARIGNAIQNTLGVGLKGLGPGMVEDAENALNPVPILSAVVGDAFPSCKQVTYPIGDQNGSLQSADGDIWVEPDGITYDGAQPYQTRWILDTYVDQDTYKAQGNGGDTEDSIGGITNPFASSDDSGDDGAESFTSEFVHSWNPFLAGGLALGLALAVAYTVAKR